MAFLLAVLAGFLVLVPHHFVLLGTSFLYMLLAVILNLSHGVVIGYVLGFFSSRGEKERSFIWLIGWGAITGLVAVIIEAPLRDLWDMDIFGALLFSTIFGGVGGILYALLESASQRNRDRKREERYAGAIADHSALDESEPSTKA